MSTRQFCRRHKTPQPEPCAVCAMNAAKFPATVAVMDLEPTPVVESAPKKRGPKPKDGVAMTPAERKARSRQKQKAKLDDAERRKLIVELMRIYDRQQADVIVTGRDRDAVARAEDRRKIDREQKRVYLEHLKTVSLDGLRLALETEKQAPDTHGRLTNERSGEGNREHGQSEIERLLAAKQHDSSLFEDENQDPLLAGGFKVKPVGAGADSFDRKDTTADTADKPTSRPRISAMVLERQKNADKKMLALVHDAFDDFGHCQVPSFCPYDRTPCTFQAENSDEALEHLWAKFFEGEKLWDHVDKLADPAIADTLRVLLVEARRKAAANVHHWVITQWMQKYKRKSGEPELRDKQFQPSSVDVAPSLSDT
jgi:hypothetical protein